MTQAEEKQLLTPEEQYVVELVRERAILRERNARLLEAVAELVRSFTTGQHYETKNPYCRSEVKLGLRAMQQAMDAPGDIYESLTYYDRMTASKTSEG